MKKLAIINHNLSSGGAEKLIYDMALELKERKYDFSIILLTSVNDIYGKKLKKQGIEVIYLSDKWDIYNPKNILKLKNILKDYDVIHTHVYAAQLWTAFVSLFLSSNKKYITTEHSTTNNRRGKWYFKYLDKWMYSRYEIIVGITEKVQEELKKWLKGNYKYKIIKNGINLEKYLDVIARNRREFHLKNEDKLICQIGRFTEIKNHKTTIEMLKLLPENYKVIFVGEGETKEEIINLTEKYKLGKRVRFLGYREDVPQIISMCDVSILTSKYEGLPLVAIESMCSTPFIGSRVAGIQELVEGYGDLFEYENYKELSKKILKLLENKNEYLKLKEKCRNRALNFDLKDMTTKYLEIYN